MERIKKILDLGIESIYTDDHETQERSRGAKSFNRVLSNEIKKLLTSAGASDIKIDAKLTSSSAFFTVPQGIYYLSISDLRHFPRTNILIRTARDYKDYTGGRNQFIRLGRESLEDLKNIVKNLPMFKTN